jgi:DNA-binding NarL/FixJ family response regulator
MLEAAVPALGVVQEATEVRRNGSVFSFRSSEVEGMREARIADGHRATLLLRYELPASIARRWNGMPQQDRWRDHDRGTARLLDLDGLGSSPEPRRTLVAGGATNREVAARLFVSEATVKSHLLHLYLKLGVNDRAAAVAAAYSQGLLTPEDGRP